MAGRYLIGARQAARQDIVPLTAADARSIGRGGGTVHQNAPGRPDGTCYMWRSNGAVKTWKTRPAEFRWPVKYGMYEFDAITEHNAHEFHRLDTCPVDAIDVLYYEALDRGEKPGAKLPHSAWGLHRHRPAWCGRPR